MTVLVKEMDLPASCEECPCSCVEDNGTWCMVTLEHVDEPERRSPYCPMYEVDEAYFSHHPQKNSYGGM